MVSKADVDRFIEQAEDLPLEAGGEKVYLWEIVFRDGSSEVIASEVEPGQGIKAAIAYSLRTFEAIVPCFWITSFGDGIRAEQVRSWRRLHRADLDQLAEELGIVEEEEGAEE